MISRFTAIIFLMTISIFSYAQQPIVWPSPEVEQMYITARGNMSKGNLKTAIVNYQQLIPMAPDVMELYRDLGQMYFLTGNYEQADKTLNSIISSGKADQESYRIAASSLAAQGENKKSKSMLEKGIEQFPKSGLLYHELGKQYDDRNEEEEALKAWLDGIEADPDYHVNYYEAARTYMITQHTVWAILYGEMFINMEHETPRANETRKMLLSAYKKFFLTPATGDAPEFGKNKSMAANSFEEAVAQSLRKLAPVVADGITTENLVMLRTRFAMEWNREFAVKYPFSLFSYHQQLLQEGLFESYNQWLYAKAESMQQYESWNNFHKTALQELNNWMLPHPYKPISSDFYNDKKVKGLFAARKK